MSTALRSTAGFTLLETMVAIMILTVGLLAVARITAMALRLSADGQARWAGAALARSRLELLRSGNCSAGSGTDASAGTQVRWTVAAGITGGMSPNAVLTALPPQTRPGTARPDTFVANLPCH
jgi:prepilin-type N-terminal cleavage/methylation domain-containing protein